MIALNEEEKGSHSDVYEAFQYCLAKNLISGYIIYSFLAKLNELKSEVRANHDFIKFYDAYKPDAILWMHTTDFYIREHTIYYIKQHNPSIIMGYWDGDAYCRKSKPIPRHVLSLARACNVLFIQDFSGTKIMLEDQGCTDIRYTPAFMDTTRFIMKKEKEKKYQIVMIGNRSRRRNPFKPNMPGVDLREKIVKAFSHVYGQQFAIFGQGWSGISAKGSVGFQSQSNVYSQSVITIAVNQISGKYYFSNRLPIAMISGIPIIHSTIEGSDKLFKNCRGLYFFNNASEAIVISKTLLQKSQQELDDIRNDLIEYARLSFDVKNVFSYIVQVLSQLFYNNESQKIKNPWID